MWTETMTLMLRFAINDVDDPNRYSDNRLQTALLVAATYINMEFSFDLTFTINLMGLCISPDPTELIDFSFVNLTVMRSALMILTNEFHAATSQAFSFKEFQSGADFRNVAVYKKTMLDTIRDMYDQQALQYRCGFRPSHAAIIGPFNIHAYGGRGQSQVSFESRSILGF